MAKKISKYNLFRILCLVAYIGCAGVLIVESCMNGQASANQSNTVGGTLADIFNDIGGDQTEAIPPTSVAIKNKIETAFVGETYNLEVETLPDNSTYKAISYSSNDSNIATISTDGLINFISEGNVTITATNVSYPTLSDSFSIQVKNIEATAISSTIKEASYDSDYVYTLYLGHTYPIKTLFTPENTTIKDLSYRYDASYLSISENGVIEPIKYSANNIIDITINHRELENTLKVKIENEHVEKLESIDITLSNNEISVGQSITPTIKMNPSTATFKDYIITSSDISIAKIEGNKIIGVKEGTATIEVRSITYTNIADSIEITVISKPDIESFSVTLSKTIVIGKTATIKIKKTPSYAKDPIYTYSSSDTSIATVDSSGKVKGISKGNVTIQVTATTSQNKTITKNCSVQIIPPVEEEELTGISINEINTNLHYGQEYDLDSLFNVSYVGTPKNKLLEYNLIDSSFGDINDNTIILEKLGSVELQVVHVQSGFSDSIILNCISFPFTLVDLDNNQLNDISLNVGESKTFKIQDDQISDHIVQTYEINSTNNNVVSISLNDEGYQISAIDEGNTKIIVSAYIDGHKCEITKEINVITSHLYASSLTYHIIDDETGNEILLNDNILTAYIFKNYSIQSIIPNEVTSSNIVYTSSNQDIASVDSSGHISFHSIGVVTITISEEISKLSKSFDVYIYNYISLDSSNPFHLEGQDLEVLEKNSFAMTNGYSGHLNINFTSDSTYTHVTYSSSDENIATISEDGTITPLKVGTTEITAVCDDGMQDRIEIKFKLTIKRQDFISDLSDFFYKVRKGLGHFGAFFVLGIFSSLTWLLFFDKKKLWFSVPTNFALGFGIAALTELIQLYVPGRCGTMSDVLLDFTGFAISAVIVSIIIITKNIVKYIKNKKKQ